MASLAARHNGAPARVMRRQRSAPHYQHLLTLPPGYVQQAQGAAPAAVQQGAWPLVLFLHGAGEGAGGGMHHGDTADPPRPPRLVAAYAGDAAAQESRGRPAPAHPGTAHLLATSAITLSPQVDYARMGHGFRPGGLLALLDDITCEGEAARAAQAEAVAEAEAEGMPPPVPLPLAVDPDRVYVTGISMGGYGTWALGAADPGRFAALLPICGGGDPAALAPRLAQASLPVLAVHGARDDIIPIEQSERLVKAIQELGGDASLARMPDAGHDCWTEAYNDMGVWSWLLEQRRRRAP
ncbi:hypothetical protein HYH03_008107 [Edaphochlamys debaryana]|uniref:Dienelactone hydrolase domain-containing protein n=1 Tax=Edaphochlamys debaryana TaxID=47281 RepID=A0A836BZN4_9CHLO|nr:hypothetical protein HYH03_008107 [Edaphochlamys debaryana]|eukprot:KAG2493588.1 hypothetical protein HYH03_008107 [Edaphochlamys debaryana]